MVLKSLGFGLESSFVRGLVAGFTTVSGHQPPASVPSQLARRLQACLRVQPHDRDELYVGNSTS